LVIPLVIGIIVAAVIFVLKKAKAGNATSIVRPKIRQALGPFKLHCPPLLKACPGQLVHCPDRLKKALAGAAVSKFNP